MARNSEKRLTGLNRFLEAKEKEALEEKRRPPLHQLSTAGDVKQWIPSIEKEINHLLQQIKGTGSRKYTDHKVEEFKSRIEYLQNEHKRFVRKVQYLDPSYCGVVPWQPRGYSRKRKQQTSNEGGGGNEGRGGGGGGVKLKKLHSPLIQKKTDGITLQSFPSVSMETASIALRQSVYGSHSTNSSTVSQDQHSEHTVPIPAHPVPIPEQPPLPQDLLKPHPLQPKPHPPLRGLCLDYSSSESDNG